MKYVLNEREISQAILDYIAKIAMPHTGGQVEVKSDIRIKSSDRGTVAEVEITPVGVGQ